jgi:CheY-like chemotaxis protein/signal transduction histidine kinase
MIQKILLVDDRPENLLVLESSLEKDELEFIRAESGEEALRQLLRNDISLILLDVQMPGMDGFEAANLIHGNPNTKHIPIIFVSAISKEQKHIFKGYESGAIDYIFKPFDPAILQSKVNILLDLDRQRRLLESQNVELKTVKSTTDSILQNVNEGIFLLNKSCQISSQYSSALEDILAQNELGNVNLLDLLQGRIQKEAYDALPEFIELSFDTNISDSALDDLNPLEQIEYHTNGNDSEALKYLSFDCRRIYDEEEIIFLIFTVTDNTHKVVMQKRMEEIEKESQRQMESLLSILHVDPKLLKDFVDSVERSISESEEIVDNSKSKKISADNQEFLYRSMHTIKGNAAILDLKLFMEEAHKAEDCINVIKNARADSKCDLDTFVQCLTNMKKGLKEIRDLISKLSHIYKYFRPKRTYEIELLFRAMKNLINNLQESTGKEVKLEYNNFDGIAIPYNCRLDLKDILVQLTRNTFHHGIESSDERKKAGKNKIGKIIIETFKTENVIGFTYRDDGRGLQKEQICRSIEKSGKFKKDEWKNWDDQKIYETIFLPGISTISKASTGAGRGVGMDIIYKMVNKLKGQIKIDTEKGKFTEFRISFPLNN